MRRVIAEYLICESRFSIVVAKKSIDWTFLKIADLESKKFRETTTANILKNGINYCLKWSWELE